MTEQAKVLVNCCGPYRFYGEPVVKACIATRTHQVDVSGEPQVRIISLHSLKCINCTCYFVLEFFKHLRFSFILQYIESMQLKYDKAAQDAGIYIISACGFDSVPCDLGIIFAQQKFDGDVNAIETYLNFWTTKKTNDVLLHYGTYESGVYGVAHSNEIRDLRKKLYPERLPLFGPKLKKRLETIITDVRIECLPSLILPIFISEA